MIQANLRNRNGSTSKHLANSQMLVRGHLRAILHGISGNMKGWYGF